MPLQHGKIDEEFISFAAEAYDKVIPPDQFVEMRRIFFAGARAATTHAIKAQSQQQRAQRLLELDKELNIFLDDVRKGRA